MPDLYQYERELLQKNIQLIAGIDEVGRGPLVGPVVASAVILPVNYQLEGLTDSKKLSEKKREKFYEILKKDALAIGIGIIYQDVIDKINIYEATKLAMKEAVKNLSIKPEHLLIDAMPLETDIPSTSIIKGDAKSLSIAAASVIAKVTRDRMLLELDKKYPMYDFKNNKGYPTKTHLEAIKKYGIIPEHRQSYAPVKEYLERNFMKEKLQKLLTNAYAPYSNYKVSSIIKTKDDHEFIGVNVENASYGATICAERSALLNAISCGYKKGDFKEIHIMTSSYKLAFPCYICRQVLIEFMDPVTKVYLYTKNETKTYTLQELTPYQFNEENL